MHTPSDFQAVVGQTFVRESSRPLLSIGKYQLSRYDLGRFGCPHPKAATELDRTFKRLGLNSIPALRNWLTYDDISNVKGIGVTAFYVLLAIADELNINVEKMIGPEPLTFNTMKRHSGKRRRNKRNKREDRQESNRAARDAMHVGPLATANLK